MESFAAGKTLSADNMVQIYSNDFDRSQSVSHGDMLFCLSSISKTIKYRIICWYGKLFEEQYKCNF